MDIIPESNNSQQINNLYYTLKSRLKDFIFQLDERDGNYNLKFENNIIKVKINILYFTDYYKDPQTVIDLIKLKEPFYIKSGQIIYKYSLGKIKYAFTGTFRNDVIVNLTFASPTELNNFLKRFRIEKTPIIFGYPKGIYGGERILLKGRNINPAHFRKINLYNKEKQLLNLKFIGRAKKEIVLKIISKNIKRVYLDFYFNFLLSKKYKPYLLNFKINDIQIKRFEPKKKDIHKYLNLIEKRVMDRMKDDKIILPHEEIYYDRDGNIINKKTNYVEY